MSTTEESEAKFKRRITLLSAIGIIVGSMIGSGIFITPKAVFEYTGQASGLSICVWMFCGLFSTIGALCYSELGTSISRSGGDYVYQLESFGKLPAFLYLWVSMFIINPASQAITSLTFAHYILSVFFRSCEPPSITVKIVAVCCLCEYLNFRSTFRSIPLLMKTDYFMSIVMDTSLTAMLTLINCKSVRYSIRLQNFFTLSKLLVLSFVITTGFLVYFEGNASELMNQPFRSDKPAKVEQLSLAVYSSLFAFGGWNYINFVTQELKQPEKNLPIAIVSGTLLVTVVYVLTNVAYFVVLDSDEILASPSIASVFASKSSFQLISFATPVAVSLSAVGALNGNILVSSRLMCIGAEEKQIPAIFAMIDMKNGTPKAALLCACFIAIITMLSGQVFQLINYFSFTVWLWTGVSTAAQVYLRYKRPDLRRPTKVNILLPITFTFLCFLLTAISIFAAPLNAAIGVIVIICAIPFFFLQKRIIHANIRLQCEY